MHQTATVGRRVTDCQLPASAVAALPRQLEIAFQFRLDPIQWTDDETELAYAVLLEESLKVLDPDTKHAKSRARKDEIRDVVRWIFASEVQYFAVDGHLVKVKTEQIPLTFAACCRFFGYAPDRLRYGVVGYLKKLGYTDGVPAEYLDGSDDSHPFPRLDFLRNH